MAKTRRRMAKRRPKMANMRPKMAKLRRKMAKMRNATWGRYQLRLIYIYIYTHLEKPSFLAKNRPKMAKMQCHLGQIPVTFER